MSSIIKVVSHIPLDAETKKQVESVFKAKHNDAVSFSYDIDPSILGGLLIIDNGIYFDSTVKSQLTKIKSLLI